MNMENFYDVVIIGGGPAGLTAALYLARAKYRVIVIEKENFGGQITITSEVVNYPGIKRTSGADLTEGMKSQAESFGAEFIQAEAQKIDVASDIKIVKTGRGDFRCFGILIATGAHPRMIGFKGEKEFKGHGVAYCATCDGEFFTGKEVFVVGGGFAAAEESVFLTKYARHVTILIREEDFTCAAAVAEPARNHKKITVITNTEVEGVYGDTTLNAIKYRNTKTGEVTLYKAESGENIGVFVFAGYEPETSLIKNIVRLDEHGYVITDRGQKTNIDGLYAAGDICVKNLRQVVTAVGDGAAAATELERYAAHMQEKMRIYPEKPQAEINHAENAPDIAKAGMPDEVGLFDADMRKQLMTVFDKMEKDLLLIIYPDDTPASSELQKYMEELAGLTDKLAVRIAADGADMDHKPCVRVCRSDGSYTGLAFHGVPGGHEFTSFVLGLYNASGSGQHVDGDIENRINAIDEQTDIRILVTLSCSMCPELVTATQKIASKNDMVTAEIYDVNRFKDMQEKYQVMSVPCMVINGDNVYFGKKNIEQVLDIIEENIKTPR